MADVREGGSLSGLTDEEAQEFHRIFIQSFIMWVAVCFVAHVLVWFWRPWFPGAESMKTSMLEGTQSVVTHVLPFLV